MGLYDRDYSRDEDDFAPWRGESAARRQPPWSRTMVVALIAINVGVYLADILFGGDSHRLIRSMEVSGDVLSHPWKWYQLLTAMFAHDPNSLGHIFMNMFGLFMIGREVERRLGSYEFLRFYLLAGLVGNIAYGMLGLAGLKGANDVALGASGAVVGVAILFACYFRNEIVLLMGVIPVKGWVVGALIVAFDVLGTMGLEPLATSGARKVRIGHEIHLAGAAVGLAYWYFQWNLSRITPLGWLTDIKRWWNRPRLKVHNPEQSYENLDDDADRVLAKLHEEGEASLNEKERRVLEAYSRRMRQKLR